MSTEATSLAEELSSAFDITSDLPDESAMDTTETPGTPEPEAAAPTDTPDSDDVELSAEEMAEIEQEFGGEETKGIEAPEHWSAEDREMFANQTPEAQEWLLARHKAMEGDYTRKNMEMADFRKAYEPIQEMFSQYPGVNPTQTIQSWAQTAIALQENPVAAIGELARMYNVELSGNMTDNGRNGIDPVNQHLLERVTRMEQTQTQRLQEEQQRKFDEIQKQIDDFAGAKDEKGELKYPFFADAEADMTALVAAFPGESLEKLYERAIYANPDLRARVLQSQQDQEKARKKAEAIAKAKQAKKQALSISGGAGTVETDAGGSLRSQLESYFD